MTKIRFLSGLNTIGANVVEISTATSRIIMDFGSTENLANLPSLETMLAKRTIPDIPELLASDMASEYKNEAIFISHLHLDHTGALALLKSPIPVYFSAESLQLYQALIKSHLTSEQLINCYQYEPNIPVTIGDLTVTGYTSDHDIIGASALVVSDGKHKYAHSGDFRLNGFHPERVIAWAHQLQVLQVDLFMTETTSFSFLSQDTQEAADDFKTPLTEMQLCEDLRTYLAGNQFPVLNVYERNIERLLAFNKVSLEANRPIVWEYPFAQLLQAFDADIQLCVLAESIPVDEKLGRYTRVSLAMIKEDIRAYSLQNTFANRNLLRNFTNIQYLHSNGAPLGEYDVNYQILREDLAKMNAQYIYFGCSGHAKVEDIIKICQIVNAKTTITWHSFHPELLDTALPNLNILMPSYDQIYEF